MGLRRVVVTPAGRQRYLEVLFRHLLAQKSSFDEWQVWVNTNVASDVRYMHQLAAAHPWVTLVTRAGTERSAPNTNNICKFFDAATDEGAMYLRLDDDVVWLAHDFVETMFAFREAHAQPYLVFGNIVNNAVVSHLHQRNGRLVYPRLGGYACMDDVGWRDPHYAHAVHTAFLRDAECGDTRAWRASFTQWHCLSFERVSINAICWLGTDMRAALPEQDEEQWLAVTRPKQLNRPNVILGAALCAHFAFFTQRAHLDTTDVLARYAALAPAPT